MTTLYKIDGEYVSWTEANRMGYTTSPSNPVSYKSADPQTWGQTEGNGLMQGDLSNPMSGSYFVEGELGWVNIENLSLVQKLYPSTAEDVVMHNTNTGNDSAGVKIESNGDYYYLISGDLSHGWIVEGDLDEFDWEEKGAATLPTVTPYRKSVQYTGYQINVGDSQFLVDSGNKISYDASVIYGFRQWVKMSSVQRTPGEIINDGGFIAAKNTGSSAVTGVYTVDYSTCSSNQAELITVLNSSDEAYNAFKYTLDGVDYYYVLDGVQNDWTDDLNSIGYHLPIPSDTATGTINNLALPTAHKEWYTNVTFESLRYYVKGTLSNTGSVQGTWLGIVGTWYYGVITWTDESVGDLTEKIAVSNFTQSAITPQSVFRIIFIFDGEITGWHPSDTLESNYNFVSAYTYNNGVHSITFHSAEPWTSGSYAGRIQFRYLDGVTTFKNLSAFDLIGVENGVLSILTTTDRFNMYNTWAGNLTIKAYYAEPTSVTTYTNPVTNSVYAKWRGNDSSNPNYSAYFRDVNGVSVGSYYMAATYMNKFYLNIPNNKYVSDAITGVTADGRYFERASSSSNITDSTKGILILNKDIYGWYIILSFYSSDISDGNYALDGSITLGTLGLALPTVSSFYEVMRDSGGQQISIVSNQSITLYGIDTSKSYPYNTSATYAAVKYASGGGGWSKVSGIFEITNVSSLIGITNISNSTQSFYSVMISVCSSNQAEVVTVLDSQDNPYNAFKFTSNGTDYYYVLDEVQTDWTDDLSSIGYHLPLPLPTVEIFADSSSGWCCTSSFPNTTNISSNYSVDLYNRDGGGTVTGRSSCDTSKKYSLIQWQAVQMVLEGRTEIEIESDTGYLRAKNISNSAITFLQARIVVCSSSDATVEMVLDADNNRYNAFKYTLNGTDYYYVLDGVQTDWTSDLSSIGYHLRSNFVFALKWRDGDWVSVNFDYEASDNYWYAGILSSEDASALEDLGLHISTSYGPYGYLMSNSHAKFEVLEVYEGLGQNHVSGYDLSTLEFRNAYTVLTLWNTVRNATNLKSYLCRVAPPEPIVILFCVRWYGSSWIAPSFTDNDWFYAGIRNNDDKYAIQGIGLSVTTRAANAGMIGNIVYDSNYNYEILELYSDIGQTVSSYTNLSNLSMGLTRYDSVDLLTIKNVTAINSGLIMSYKLRITKKQS